MRKVILVILTITVIVAGFVIANKREALQSNDESKPTVKIGAILPLTGGMANLGIAGNNGAILAIEELNKNPDNKYHYDLVSEDTATDAKRAVPIFKKMVDINKVSAIVSFDSQAGHVVKTLAAQDKITHISSAADPTVADGEYNFINSSDLYLGVEKLLKYFEEKGYKKVAIASTNHIAAQRVIEILEDKIKGYDMEIVAKELVNPTEQQIKPEAYKIAQSNPDVIFLYGFEPMTSLYAKELKNAGNKSAISSIYTLSYSEHPELLEGSVYLDYGNGSENFKEKYHARFSAEPNPASAVIFDSVNILANKYEKNAESVNSAVENFTGVNGKLVMRNNGLIHADLIFVKMTNGKPVVIEE